MTIRKLKKDEVSLIRPTYIILGIDTLISLLQCVIGMDSWPDRKAVFETVILYNGLWKNYPIWFLMTLFVCKLLVVLFGKKGCYGIALVCAGCCILNLNEMLPAFWLFTTISAIHHKEVYNSIIFQLFVTGFLIEIYFCLFKRRKESGQ